MLVVEDSSGRKVFDFAFVRIDNFEISHPKQFDVVNANSPVEIKGSSVPYRDWHLVSVKYGEGKDPKEWSDKGVSLTKNEGTDVVFASIGAGSITISGWYTVELVFENPSKLRVSERVVVYFDTLLRSGFPKRLSDRNINSRSSPIIANLIGDSKKEIVVESIGSFNGKALNVVDSMGNNAPDWPKDFNVDGTGYQSVFSMSGVNYIFSGNGQSKIEIFNTNGRTITQERIPSFCASILPFGSSKSTFSIVQSDEQGRKGKLQKFDHRGVSDSSFNAPYVLGKDSIFCPVKANDLFIAPFIEGIMWSSCNEQYSLRGECRTRFSQQGTKPEIIAYDSSGNIAWRIVNEQQHQSDYLKHMVVGNVFGDDKEELVVLRGVHTLVPKERRSYSTCYVDVYDHLGKLVVGWPKEVFCYSNGLALADFNDDLLLDIVVIDKVFKGDGIVLKSLNLEKLETQLYSYDMRPRLFANDYQYITIGDINMDGKEEILGYLNRNRD